MQTATDTELLEFHGWTIRRRKASPPPTRVLLLLHGLTGDENSMWVFARDLPATYEFIAPRAPYHAEPFGFSWRPMQDAQFGRPTLDHLQPAVEGLIKLVEAYQVAAGVEAQSFDVVGFSQGGVMSSLLAYLYPEKIRKVGLLSGFVPAGVEAMTAKRPLNGKHIFVAHGTVDETVPVTRARTSIEVLEQAGAHVTYCEDEVGHKVSLPCLRALKEFLATPLE